MEFHPSIVQKVFAFLQQKSVLAAGDVDAYLHHAQEQSCCPLQLALEERSALGNIVARVVSKLSKRPYEELEISTITDIDFNSSIAMVTLQDGRKLRGVVDPMVFSEEEREDLVVFDHGAYQLLKARYDEHNPESEETNDVVQNDENVQKDVIVRQSDWELIDGDANDQLQRILGGCIDMDASDIHIDVDIADHRLVFRIRFRIDGVVRDMVIDPRKSIYEGIVSRLKTLSHCRLDESRIPQDGRVPFVHKGKNYEFRISFNPVTKKNEQLEKVVLRQMADVNTCNLNYLGILPYNMKFFREAIALPYGFNVVTGPTGSGKTTTLYSVLQEIDRGAKNVCSIEEPIEAEVDRVNQTQVRHDIGLDFSRVLRALLRQDPDVIMVGEMRDLETAETALDAALTGHVVWSTLHTNSAVASISRLIQMGIKDYMAANALAFIVAQRLVQRICTECRVPHVDSAGMIEKHIRPAFKGACPEIQAELEKYLLEAQIFQPQRGVDCSKCLGQGFKGRVGVMEILKMNDAIREIIITDQGNEQKMQKEAVDAGMMTMEQYGYLKVLLGETSVDAVLAVVRG
ncbi:MAG: GspE/PulE family protein [Candidatus Gracilibacteria bacterium]|nr:GspE/PulE family protein [Candidatus Gracilibacteria bacterium]